MNEKILKQLNNKKEYYPLQLSNQFPNILDKLMAMWDSVEFDSFLNTFMLDKRDHPRHGFPPKVASELLRISMLHSELFGTTQTANNWIEFSNI